MHMIDVSVLRSPYGDCTNGGVSSEADTLTLICGDVPPCFVPDPDAFRYPVIKIEANTQGTVRAIPVGPAPAGHVGPMMGGNYVATSDSRFRDEVERVLGARFYGAVALHDRYESQALYDSMWP